MDLTIEAATLLLYLTPGLLASLLLNSLVVRREKDAFSKVVEALVFSLLIYALTRLIWGELPDPFVASGDGKIGSLFRALILNASTMWRPMLLAVAIPAVLGWLHTLDLHMKALRWIRITNKTGRDSAWLDVFTDQTAYVIVNFTDGRRAIGWSRYYSNTFEEGILYLTDVEWYGDEGVPVSSGHPGLLVIRRETINYIEFTELTRRELKKRERLKKAGAKHVERQRQQPAETAIDAPGQQADGDAEGDADDEYQGI